MLEKRYRFNLNGEWVEVEAPPAATLLEVLRDKFHLTGVKEGCGKGDCGACTVLLNGKPVHSCLTIMEQVQGAEITTVEGLSRGGKLDPIQQAFIEEGAIQCGFCTPGMLMVAKALLMRNPNPTIEDVREALGGTLCRCTGYVKLVKAILKAAELMGERR